LECVVVDKRLLHRVQLAAGQALDGRQLTPPSF
jgi:hypothetical protein